MGRRLGRLLYEGKWFDPEAMMLKTALVQWVAPSITGQVTLELRRGDDYTIVDTRAPHMAYGPEKLSMEKVKSAFSPEDRIGALEMQNLSVEDNRALLANHLRAVAKLTAEGGRSRPVGVDRAARKRRALMRTGWRRPQPPASSGQLLQHPRNLAGGRFGRAIVVDHVIREGQLGRQGGLGGHAAEHAGAAAAVSLHDPRDACLLPGGNEHEPL